MQSSKLDQFQRSLNEYKPPVCCQHPDEKIVRICINPQCKKYFELACMECLDGHNHNIQELIKLKDFFQILYDQTQEIQPQSEEKQATEEKIPEKNKKQAVKPEFSNDFELVQSHFDLQPSEIDDLDLDHNFEVIEQKAGIIRTVPKSQPQLPVSKCEQVTNLQKDHQNLSKLCAQIGEKLVIIDESIEKEKNTSTQSQVREILEQILIKDQNNSAVGRKPSKEEVELLQAKMNEIRPLILNNKSLKIYNAKQVAIDNRIERFHQAYKDQLFIVQTELEKLLTIDFNQFNNDNYDRFSFSKNLRGNKTILTLKNKGIIQNGNEQRFVLLEPKLDLYKKNRWALQIVSVSTWAGLGIANKSIIVREKFEFTKYTGNGIHGSYLVSNNGYSWNYRDIKQNMTVNNFNFTTGDTVLIEYNPVNKKLIFISVRQKKFVTIDLTNMEEKDEHMPCVNLCQGSNIKIDDGFVWPSIEILKGYSGYSDLSTSQLFQ